MLVTALNPHIGYDKEGGGATKEGAEGTKKPQREATHRHLECGAGALFGLGGAKGGSGSLTAVCATWRR